MTQKLGAFITGKKCFVQKRIVKSKRAGVLFKDACTLFNYHFLQVDLTATIFLLTWTSTARFVDSDMKVPRRCSKFLSRLSVSLISEFL